MADPRVTARPVTRLGEGAAERFDDAVAVERPLEIRVDGRPLAVTLRTPGDDEELTTGFLAGEQVVRRAADIAALVTRTAECAEEPDLAEVQLAKGVPFDWSKLERHFAASSACGLCGRAHLESLRAGLEPLPATFRVRFAALAGLSARLRTAQSTFTATGGLHAAAWCTGPELAPECLREDVGRHNAVDKVTGWLMRANRYPVCEGVLWVSGRAGAEIVLKAARARMPLLAAIGAPSSLAITLAEAAGLTLVGFLREGRMNVYCGEGRIAA